MLNIQPRCPIDEYARSGRKCVWFIPRMPPVRAFIAARMSRTFDEEGLLVAADNNDSGAIFCHVERIRQFLQEIEDIIDGYQK